MNPENNLESFGAYQKALELFDLVVTDLAPLTGQPALSRLVESRGSLCHEIIGILTATIKTLRSRN